MKISISLNAVLAFLLLTPIASPGQNKIIVFQSDFGLGDGAVSVMKGIAMGVSPDLKLFDITHEIPAYNIWEGAVRLFQTIPYWPAGTVFVSVVDPGVGTGRKQVVAKTNTGQFIVTPDNGTLTLVAESPGITAVREIDLSVNRRSDTRGSYTFEGRDVFAYTAARLAGGLISFEQAGPALSTPIIKIPFQKAVLDSGKLKGNIYVLDQEYGNLWTNIGADLFERINPEYFKLLHVKILQQGRPVYSGDIPYCRTFGDVETGKPLAYLNSLMQLSFALNCGNFAKTFGIGSGNEWSVEVILIK